MIDLTKCEGWQKRDTDGMTMPWYVHTALDEICKWDLSDKRVFEFGIGQSSLWWAKRCKFVYGVDSNEEWVKTIKLSVNNGSFVHAGNKQDYVNSFLPDLANTFDIIIVDGDYRDECIGPAIIGLKPGGKLIIDNWDQPSVWVPNSESRRLIRPLKHTIYDQKGHYDWQTLIATV